MSAPRKDFAVHVSLSSDSIVKQRSGDPKRRNILSPALQSGGFWPEKLERNVRVCRMKRRRQRRPVISPARLNCQHGFEKNRAAQPGRHSAAPQMSKCHPRRIRRYGEHCCPLQDRKRDGSEKFEAEQNAQQIKFSCVHAPSRRRTEFLRLAVRRRSSRRELRVGQTRVPALSQHRSKGRAAIIAGRPARRSLARATPVLCARLGKEAAG